MTSFDETSSQDFAEEGLPAEADDTSAPDEFADDYADDNVTHESTEVDIHSGIDSDIDSKLDAEIEAVNDGGESVRPVVTAESLPLAMSTRDAFLHARDVPVTGDARVDAATARLGELVDLPTSDHAAVYDDVHRRLQDALADADQR